MRGDVKSLGADCVEKPLKGHHKAELRKLLDSAGLDDSVDLSAFRRYGSARKLYHFHIDNVDRIDDGPGPLDPHPHRASRQHLTTTRLQKSDEPRRRVSMTSVGGGGAKRKLPHFDDLLFLGASISRYPLEGYREKCATDVTIGTRFAKKPVKLKIPITIAGMSFGALSGPAKEALGRGASAAGTSTTTGDGGMTAEERTHSKTLVYQVLPSRYGINPDDLRKADAIEVVIGQGAKPGGGGMLLGQKITKRVADMRRLPEGIDQRSACRHPDWTGPDDLEIKIQTNCERLPIGRSRFTSKLAHRGRSMTWPWQ